MEAQTIRTALRTSEQKQRPPSSSEFGAGLFDDDSGFDGGGGGDNLPTAEIEGKSSFSRVIASDHAVGATFGGARPPSSLTPVSTLYAPSVLGDLSAVITDFQPQKNGFRGTKSNAAGSSNVSRLDCDFLRDDGITQTHRRIYAVRKAFGTSVATRPASILLSNAVNTNNNNENHLFSSETGSSGDEEPFVDLFKVRETMKQLLKQVYEDCSRVDSKSREMEEVLQVFGGSGSAMDRRFGTVTHRIRNKAEREHANKLKDNLVAKLRSLQSSSRDLENVLKLLYRLEQDVQLKSQARSRDVEVALKSNALLKAAVGKKEEEMRDTRRYVAQLEEEAKKGKTENNAEIVKLIETTQRMKNEMATMRSNHSSLVVESQRLMERLGVAEERKTDLEARMKEVDREKEEWRRKSEENQREAERNKKKVVEGKQKFEEMEIKMARFRGEMTDLMAEVNNRNQLDNSSTAEMEQKLLQLEHHLRQSEAETARLETALKRKEEEAEELKASTIARRAEEGRLAATKAFERIRDFLEESTTELKTMDNEAVAMERNLTSAEGDVATLKEEVVRLNSVIDAYERKTIAAVDENRILKQLVDQQKANLGRVEAHSRRVEEEAEKFKSSMRDYASSLSSLPEDLRRVETELVETKESLAECRRQLSLKDAALESLAADARSAVSERENAIEEIRGKMKTIETELKLRERQLEVKEHEDEAKKRGEEDGGAAMEEAANLRNEISRLRSREEEYEAVLKTLVNSREVWEKSHSGMETQNAALKIKLKATKKKLEKCLEEMKTAAEIKKVAETQAEAEKRRIFEDLDAEKRHLVEALERLRLESTEGLKGAEDEQMRKLEELKTKDAIVVRLEEEKRVLLEEIEVMKEKEKVLEQLLETMDREKVGEERRKGAEEEKNRESRRKLEEKVREIGKMKEELERLKEESGQTAIFVEEKIQTEYATKFGDLQAELKGNRKENKRLKKQTSNLEAEVQVEKANAYEEKRKRENLERHVARLRGFHSRLFVGPDGGGELM